MFKKIMWGLGAAVSCLLILALGFGFWVSGLMMKEVDGLSKTQPSDLSYLDGAVNETRGRILMVLTSTGSSAIKGKNLGYELTELSRAYYVFKANGFDVDVASTRGGAPKVVIDRDDMGIYDYAFLNDVDAQVKVENTLLVDDVTSSDYAAIYFVGGKGTLFDFPNNGAIQNIVREMYEQGKVVAAICHGPAALLNVTLSNGTPLLSGKRLTAFTDEEELFLMPDAEEKFPFLLESEIQKRGARFNGGPLYLDHIVVDDRLITGQNPWSVWRTADEIVKALGFVPKERETTAGEYAVDVLIAYQSGGKHSASATLLSATKSCGSCLDRNLITMHALVAAMQGKLKKSVELLGLVRQAKIVAEG